MSIPLILGGLTVGVSCVAVIWLGVKHFTTRQEWVLHGALSTSVLLLAFLAGTWAFTSYYLRFLFLVLFALAAVRSYRQLSRTSVVSEKRSGASFVAALSLLFVFVLLDFLAIQARDYPPPPISLAFPLKSGMYYVLQGGNSHLTNPFHHRSRISRFI